MAMRKSYALPVFEWNGDRPLIEMENIHKVFHSSAGDIPVLKDIYAQIQLGEFVSVVGRSGSGKSTLVNMITGIDRPSGGVVRVGETVLHRMPEGRMSAWRGKHLGIVFQFFQLLPMLTLIENVMLPMDFCNMFPPSEREERAMRLLKRVSLEDVAHKLPAAVSGGQQQSAAVARALANDPPIIIADEPTGNLDSKTAEEIMQLFEELESQGKTLLMVTHDSTLAQRTSRTLLISDGEMVKEAVARAFPTLPHEQMLRLSHSAREMILQPGEPVPEIHPEKQPVYVVSRGTLEVYPDKTSQSSGVPAATIQTWKYLDPFEWDNKNPASLQLRAGPTTPLLLVVLEREDLSGAGGLIAPAPEQAEPQKKERNDWLSRLWRKP